MASSRHQQESYEYEDATPDIAARQGYGGPTYTPPRQSPQNAERFAYGDGIANVPDFSRPTYTPPIIRPDLMGERGSSYHGGSGELGIDLNDFDKATTLHDEPRRATMSFGDQLNAPPGFGAGNGNRSRSGSNDSDFLTAAFAPEPPTHMRHASLQDEGYDSYAHYPAARRNSLQEALARSGTSPQDQQYMMNHQGPRRSSLQHVMTGGVERQQYVPPQRTSSMGYGPGGAQVGRYDAAYAGFSAQPRPAVPAGPLYTVKLKRNQRTFVLGPRIKTKLFPGTYVKVEADRGEDLGIVVGEASPDQLEQPRRGSYGGFERRSSNGGRGDNVRDQPKKILRLATKEEVALLATRRQEELEMHQLCVQKVRERGLDMRIVDAEYQFDRNKLTFYFEAERRVDFRDLVRELFMICGTRIWMCQINTYATSTASRPSSDDHDEEDHSVPIIAPPSEFLG